MRFITETSDKRSDFLETKRQKSFYWNKSTSGHMQRWTSRAPLSRLFCSRSRLNQKAPKNEHNTKKRNHKNQNGCHSFNAFASSAPRDVFGFVASLESRVGGVKPLFTRSKQSPAGGFGHVVQGWERLPAPAVLLSLDQVLETLVVDPGPPIPVQLKLKPEQQSLTSKTGFPAKARL